MDDLWDLAKKELQEQVRKHQVNVSAFREEQLIECIIQAIKCGDFMLYIQKESDSSDAVYVPFAQVVPLKERIAYLEELLANEGIDTGAA